MKQYAKRILFFTLAMTFLLAACAPAAATPNLVELQNQVATSVALTVASQNLETQQAAPVATETLIATQTVAVVDSPTPLLPTATPFVIVPPTTAPGGGGGGVTVVRPDFDCDSISRRPRDNEVFKPGDTFDIKWTIVNTGTKTMIAGLDLKFSIGTLMANVDRVELPQLRPGEQYTVDFDGVAPDREGTYIMTFVVEGGLCYPYTAIVVER
jgi:hypothetical protein